MRVNDFSRGVCSEGRGNRSTQEHTPPLRTHEDMAADVVLLDLGGEHIVEEEEFVSAGISSPVVGWKKRDGAML